MQQYFIVVACHIQMSGILLGSTTNVHNKSAFGYDR